MKKKNKKAEGFSLVELLIVMSVFVVVIAIASDTFTLLLKQSAQQTGITESEVERMAGLELLRSDIEKAGFGLPWSFQNQNTIYYEEAADPLAAKFNDAPAGVPRAIISGNNLGINGGINGSDYLVLKGTAFGSSAAVSKWSYVTYVPPNTPVLKSWASSGGSDFVLGDQVIVIAPQVSDTVLRQLVMSGKIFNTVYPSGNFDTNFSPASPGGMYLIYGVADRTIPNPRMPFNRVDYFIQDPAVMPPPKYCAPHTGELVRAFVSQADGTLTNGTLTNPNPPLPVLDCVADMHIVYQLDKTGNGTLSPTDVIAVNGAPSPSPPALTAQQIAQQVKEIDVYILTHEGKADTNFSYPNSTVVMGLGSTFDLQAIIGVGYQNYRWKVQKIVVRPKNLD